MKFQKLDKISDRKEWKKVADNITPTEEVNLLYKNEKLKPCEILFLATMTKYNVTEQLKRFAIYRSKSAGERKANTLENYQLKCGKKIGKLLFKNKNNKSRLTLKNFINKYGKEEGLKKYKESNQKRSGHVSNFIRRYGEELGLEKYKSFCERNKGNKSLERMIEQYGEAEGLKRFKIIKSKQKQMSSLDFFVKKHGQEKGTEIFEKKIEKLQSGNQSGYSKISQNLFKKIEIHFTKKERKEIFYATKNKEKWITKYRLDFLFRKKCIEFHGDKFHANPLIYRELDRPNPYTDSLTSLDIWSKDKNKIEDLQKSGLEVMVVWESEYKKDPGLILEKCLNFLKE